MTGQVVTLAGGQAIQGAIVSATTLEGQVLAVTATDGWKLYDNEFTTRTAHRHGYCSQLWSRFKNSSLQTNGIISTTLFLSMAPGFLTGTVKVKLKSDSQTQLCSYLISLTA
ncbi:hypothetical protein F6Y02_00735 [Bacillus megaterium]|nr:hypothetical protein [Priestia megaterium]